MMGASGEEAGTKPTAWESAGLGLGAGGGADSDVEEGDWVMTGGESGLEERREEGWEMGLRCEVMMSS